eukprot:15479286-Alexandrium_andersonii.AAC.1
MWGCCERSTDREGPGAGCSRILACPTLRGWAWGLGGPLAKDLRHGLAGLAGLGPGRPGRLAAHHGGVWSRGACSGVHRSSMSMACPFWYR